jgi:Cu(I)/Ag(I) efflux system membrane fusion protein
MRIVATGVALALFATAGAVGYWLGTRSTSMAGAGVVATTSTASAPVPRKPLYYRNPMGLADTSPTPKKDPMGMDYVPVYEGENESKDPASPNQIRIGTEKIQRLGVRVEAVSKRQLKRSVRAAGRIEPDERRVFAIAPRFEGYVERLHVNVTGQPVARGQPLFEVYSPELVSAQREYSIAMQGVQAMKDATPEAQGGMNQLAESSLARLRNWGLSPAQVTALTRTAQTQRTITFPSPVSGVVTEKKALQGMRFMPGDVLYQVTDLSSVWVVADLAEQDIGLIQTGAMASVTTTAYPNKVFQGRVTYVYPTLKAETRTVAVRVELANPGQLLKPAMYAQVDFVVGAKVPVLTVPDSAVIDTGTRRIVLVQIAEGRFEPREVELGGRGENLVEVLGGVREGEQVVVAANFLIDAESNLKAAIGGMGGQVAQASPGQGADAAKPDKSSAPAASGHKAEGSIDAVDPRAGTVTIRHGAVPSLKWPAMTMEFRTANASLLSGLKPGQAIAFEFVERQPGEFVVTSIAAAPPTGSAQGTRIAPGAAARASASSHSGH